MISVRYFGFSACMVLIAVVSAAAQPFDELNLRRIAEASDSVHSFMQLHGVPGVSIAVGRDGAVVWSDGFGYADLENQVPVTPATRMRIASISKPVTAAGVARLLEQDRLDLDADIRRYVPYFPDNGQRVTTRQLAGHLGGIRHYQGEEYFVKDNFRTVRDGLSIFLNDTLVHPPGTAYLYSSYGWNLISAVVEGASGREFLSYMRENVFSPLAMNSTSAEHVDSLIPNRARFYVRTEEGTLLNAPYVDNSLKWAGGGFVSTAGDLVRFGNAHLNSEFLNENTIELLFTSQRTAGGDETGYGIGWQLRTEKGRAVVGHSGGAVGGSSMLMLIPEDDLVVAVIGNLQGGPMRRLALAIVEIFLREPDLRR